MGESTNKVYEIVTDKIVALLEQGVCPWRRPWRSARAARADKSVGPVNAEGREYSGINFLILSVEAMAHGYQSNVWITFRKAQELGGQVRKGEKSTLITFWKQLEVEREDKEGVMRKVRIPMLRYYLVFNVDQCENVKLPKRLQTVVVEEPAAEPTEEQPVSIEAAEAIIAGMPNRPTIDERQSDRACYSPGLDLVTLPSRTQYTSIEEFYSTAFHELGHSTGHKSRLDRKDFGTGEGAFSFFGDAIYSREELVAELTSAFLCAQAGIDNDTITNSAAYLQSWAGKLADDPKVIITAAGQAQKAANYILGKIEVAQVEEEQAA